MVLVFQINGILLFVYLRVLKFLFIHIVCEDHIRH